MIVHNHTKGKKYCKRCQEEEEKQKKMNTMFLWFIIGYLILLGIVI